MQSIREIVFDTETTGFDPLTGDRLVEIGAVELINHVPTGRTYHQYINPDRDVPEEVVKVHGLTNEFLKDYPFFDKVAQDWVDFIGDDGITPLKPNVEMVNKALKQLNLSNKECLYVGDSKVDILTAKNAKIKNVSVTYGYQDIKVLKTYENDYLIDNIKEIINIIIKENQND